MWRYLHMQGNTVLAPAGEKLWKLRWFLDHLTLDVAMMYSHKEQSNRCAEIRGRVCKQNKNVNLLISTLCINS